ncbi:lamin tail domain-containing protein [Nonomuraea sp. 3-1Str]|uniref:lamin tail domain-containing protein n=1 Tax=Nonomuraea sp. 3-1Str TaxID=2929801 RepID=UPI00285DA72A|nr:lamin tail domain-containing protein [Nonomuraea sp. 3-1Str]MDR8413243.1 lamin tail domain-containing protein [Nonomuraea sp. 3-1Str]
MRLAASVAAMVATAAALTPAAPAQAAAPTVKISRIWYDSPGSPDSGANSNLNGEYVQIKNAGRSAVNLSGWTVRDKTSRADHVYTFGTFTLGAGKAVTLRTGKGRDTSTTLYWGRSGGTYAYIWNQSTDTGYLRNARGQLVHSCSYNSARADYKNC